MNENSATVVFNVVNIWGTIVINCPNCLVGTNVNKTYDACLWLLLTTLQCSISNFGRFSLFLSWSTLFFALS